jgi:hypothetical protein
VTENSKRQSHIMVVFILILDIVLNSIIGLTPYVDNFTRKWWPQVLHLCVFAPLPSPYMLRL